MNNWETVGKVAVFGYLGMVAIAVRVIGGLMAFRFGITLRLG